MASCSSSSSGVGGGGGGEGTDLLESGGYRTSLFMPPYHHHHAAADHVSPRRLQLFGSLAGHTMPGQAGDALTQHSDKFNAPYKDDNANDKFASEVRKILGGTPPISSTSTQPAPAEQALALQRGQEERVAHFVLLVVGQPASTGLSNAPSAR